MHRRYVTLTLATLLLLAPPAFADSYKLISGAILCKGDDGLKAWQKGVEEKNEAARSALLESGECLYNFRAQIVETVGLRMFFKTVKVKIDGVVWITEKKNLRVPAPKPGGGG